MKYKRIALLLPVLALAVLCAVPAFAVTEAEVEAEVASQGKEAVSGNLFIWFLCAIAFLKVSTKLDSFMQALGLGVGRPQGSVLTEALMAMRGMEFSKALGGIAGAAGHHGGGKSAVPAEGMSGGLAGVVGRHLESSTANAMGGAAAGGLASGIGTGMYKGSLGKENGFASRVIGSVATGENPGVISGDAAAEALGGYFESSGVPGTPDAAAAAGTYPETPLALDDGEPVPVSGPDSPDASFRTDDGTGMPQEANGTVPVSPGIQQAALDRVMQGQMGNPTADVEIGGGKITGREIIPGRGHIQFAMYNAAQFERPEGRFSTQTSLDGQKWYKVYGLRIVL